MDHPPIARTVPPAAPILHSHVLFTVLALSFGLIWWNRAGGTTYRDSRIDSTVTAGLIAGNPTKYIGKHVRLHCTVENVTVDGIANVECGPTILAIESALQNTIDVDNIPTTLAAAEQRRREFLTTYAQEHGYLVLEGSAVRRLDTGDRIRVTGTVLTAYYGKNTLGTYTSFPAVHADLVEPATD